MNINDVDNALKAADEAKTKAQLQDAVTPFGIDLDLRKTMGALKEGVTAALNDVRADLQGQSDQGDKTAEAQPDSADEGEITLPELGKDAEPEEKPAGNRILVNKLNGRRFVWTPILAKLPDLEEV